MILLLLALAVPNPAITPGRANYVNVQQVCSMKWGKDARHVTEAMKRQVAQAYGIPWDQHGQYEFDHLIPRELGGADDVRDIWPQPWAEARVKDREENRLHRAVCAGTMTLPAAQAQMQQWGKP